MSASKHSAQNGFKLDTSKLAHNLDQLMKENALSANYLASLIGIPATSIKRIRTNTQANPTLATIIPLASYFGISVDQLIGGALSSHRHQSQADDTSDQQIKVPLVDWDSTTVEPQAKRFIDISPPKNHTQLCALKVEEDDLPPFAKGSLLLIEKKERINHKDFIIVKKTNQEKASLKQALIEEDVIYMKSLALDIPPMKLTQEYDYIGTVIQSIQHFGV